MFFKRLLQCADKAEEGYPGPGSCRRVGLKRRNSPFSGKFALMSVCGGTHRLSDNGPRDVTFCPDAKDEGLYSGVWK